MTTAASERFGKIASNYANSEVHATSPTLKRLHELVGPDFRGAVCDVACGAGHTGLSFAGKATRIVGVDPATEMLQAFRTLGAKKDLTVEGVESFAENIALPDNTFDVVTSRLAPHHFSDIDRALREMARITKPGGFVAIIDLEGDANPELDELNHRIEVLHDPTHIRSYTAKRWTELLTGAGLAIEIVETRLTEKTDGVPLHRWCEIASSGDAAELALRNLLAATSAGALDALGIIRKNDEFFVPVRTLLITARKRA